MAFDLETGDAFLTGLGSGENVGHLLFSEIERRLLSSSRTATKHVHVIPTSFCIIISVILLIITESKCVCTHQILNRSRLLLLWTTEIKAIKAHTTRHGRGLLWWNTTAHTEQVIKSHFSWFLFNNRGNNNRCNNFLSFLHLLLRLLFRFSFFFWIWADLFLNSFVSFLGFNLLAILLFFLFGFWCLNSFFLLIF